MDICTPGGKTLRGNDLTKYGRTRKSLGNVASAALRSVTMACTGKPALNWDITTRFSFLMEYTCLLLMALYWQAVELRYRTDWQSWDAATLAVERV